MPADPWHGVRIGLLLGTILGIRPRPRATVFGTARIHRKDLAATAATILHTDLTAREPVLGLHLVRGGELVVEDLGSGTETLPSGSAFVTQRATRATATRATKMTVLDIPAEVVKGIPMPDSAAWRITESALLPPAVDFIVRAGEARDLELNGFGTYYFERLLQEMFVGLLIDTNRPAPTVRPQQPVAHALAVIAGRCTDPDLTPAVVAQEVRLSLRQLQRLFRERDTTVGGEIRRARVDHALSLLRDSRYEMLSVDQVAQHSGFGNGSSLARAMAAEGHESPTREARGIGRAKESRTESFSRAA